VEKPALSSGVKLLWQPWWKQSERRSQHSQECKDLRQRCFCDSWPWPL